MLQELVRLFEFWSGEKLSSSQELTQAGSNRRYFRLRSESKAVVGCYGKNLQENHAFIALSQHFEKQKLSTPQVLASSECGQYYLQQDFGDTSLFHLIAAGRESGVFSEEEKRALRKTISVLPQLQFEGDKGLDYSACYPQAEWGKSSIMWDLSYFKYYFLRPTFEDFNEEKLERDFTKLREILLNDKNSCFMYRDFQSRNVMWHEGEPHFIDFQGGRKGVPAYDVASFLYQAKANFSDELREELLQVYLENAAKYTEINAAEFRKSLPIYALLRSLQTLGAYGYRGYFERKAHFLQSVPFALANLKKMLDKGVLIDLQLTYLNQLLYRLIDLKQEQAIASKAKLHVDVVSFSYRVGLPEDASGNGGGFVFDCRCIHNPGREEQYRFFTGLDAPVSEYLDGNAQMQEFLQHAYALADTAVERYLARGFSHLQVSFGCTGGQHRSVYSAQHMAEHLHQKFAELEVRITHREQGLKFQISNS
ncbi:MAG: phosphotransferase [Prevotellaceae bacterium]|jgi:aminoglycoside/choline kinase family phosphotransferase|nr:phosphotransferase [Prevotellaceae bacterium]